MARLCWLFAVLWIVSDPVPDICTRSVLQAIPPTILILSQTKLACRP